MAGAPISIAETALLLCDLQNDFIHPRGAYGRAGQSAPAIAALPARLAPLVAAIRAKGGWIASTHFTLVPGRDGEPFISEHLRRMRPFLGKGDFAPGSWGQALVEELAPSELPVEKLGYDAFWNSRLEWVLRRAGVRKLLVAGIVTNGGVASTVRGAHVREFDVKLLEDGCAAFSEEIHRAAVEGLRPVAEVTTVAEALAALG
ncbi:cysteine hydrolase [Neoroseomonas rubea]|uniref:cysteine hydrolase n=1 Tax=Neoroseomonas rubea TaxID=2748666 RepID=UPI0018DF3224|nr:cysteine hydrolase [Roseomonas rubea]